MCRRDGAPPGQEAPGSGSLGNLPGRRAVSRSVGPVEIIHGGVEAREDGRGQEARHVPLKEVLALRFTEDDFVVQGRVFSTL